MKYIQTGPTGGDETAPYSIQGFRAKTVVEFINEMLEECPRQWGYIEVKGESAGVCFLWSRRIEYRSGQLLAEIPDDWKYREIEMVHAVGGWGYMSFFITPKQLSHGTE